MKATRTNCKDCNNKALVPVTLPENAKGWIYSITFAPRNKSLNQTGELLDQVVQIKSVDSLSDLDQYVKPQKTNRSSNIYILRGKESADSFSQCGFFYHHGKFIHSSSKVGYVENTEGETFYIGIERDSDWQGLQVKVEVVAVI